MKQFTIGFNGTDKIDRFLYETEKREKYIHDIFTECPGIETFMTVCNDARKNNYMKNCENFLEETKNSKIKITILFNDVDYYLKYDPNELDEYAKKISKAIEKYNIYGLVTTNYTIAEFIHNKYTDVQIITSCNLPLYNLNHYKKLMDLGITMINPPRDASRNIPLLKMLKENGFKIRLLINESCSINCLNYGTCGCTLTNRKCICNEELLKRCYVLPRWLNILDEYVDVYKLTTRAKKYISSVFHPLDVYIERKDCQLNELFLDPSDGNEYTINTSEIPDTLLYCDKFHCEECGVCNQLYEKYPILKGKFKPYLYQYPKQD